MAIIHKQLNRPYWFYSFTSTGGKRHLKSTKTKKKTQALVICRKWELAGRKAKSGRLTPDAAREVIAQGVAEIFVVSDGGGLPRATVRQWCARWLESKALESAPTTLARYQGTIDKFLLYLDKTADMDLEHVTSSHIEGLRNQDLSRIGPCK